MQGKVNSHKENGIRVFGFAMENSLENDFPVFCNILKMLFSYKFFHIFSTIFSSPKQIVQ